MTGGSPMQERFLLSRPSELLLSSRRELVLNERKPEQPRDIPIVAAICLVLCTISIVVIVPMEPPVRVLDAIAAAIAALAVWISSSR
jgi:hypothetical protein